jgi:hypothetical protein
METIGSSKMLLRIYLITQYYIKNYAILIASAIRTSQLKLITNKINMARVKFKVLAAVTKKNAVLTCHVDRGSRFL